jgi:DNA-binding NtrC family response regulator
MATLSRTVIIAEDEPLISMALEDEFTSAGWTVAGPFRDCCSARRWLNENSDDVAMLDAVLTDGLCVDLATDLHDRGIPFIVCSGTILDRSTPEELRHATWLDKPMPAADVQSHASLLAGAHVSH